MTHISDCESLTSPSMPGVPILSVIIPMRAGQYPQKALACLSRARPLKGPIEIVLVEGKAPAWQRNEAVARASADILYFLDDDSYVQSDTLSEGMQFFNDPSVAVVGGPAVTHAGASFFEKCAGEVFASHFGGCLTRARNTPVGVTRLVSGEELVLCNLMIRKATYEHVAGLDTRLYPGEDPEFIKRLHALGTRMYYHPRMIVSRTRRSTVHGFVKQVFRYGRGRGIHLLEGTRPADLLFLLPLMFLLYVIALPLMPSTLSIVPLFAYLALAGVSAAVVAARTNSPRLGCWSFALFPLLHLFYGAGMARGLFDYIFERSEHRFSSIKVTVLRLAQESPQEAALAASARIT